MDKFLLVFLVIFSPCSGVIRPFPPQTRAGVENRFGGRYSNVVNGRPLIKARFDSLVSIQNAEGAHLCAGVLIDQDFVLTSASCFIKREGFYEFSEIQVRGDSIVLVQAEHRLCKRIFIHKDFDRTDFAHDVALLEIEPFENEYLGDILTSIETPKLDQRCSVLGWAHDSTLDTLRAFNISARVGSSCEARFGVSLDSICVEGLDSCLNGAGNVLVCDEELSGILSFGYGCDMKGVPNVFTDVSSYIQWADEVIRGVIYNSEDVSNLPVLVRMSREEADPCTLRSLNETCFEVFCGEYTKLCSLPSSPRGACRRGNFPYSCQYLSKTHVVTESFYQQWFALYYHQIRLWNEAIKKSVIVFEVEPILDPAVCEFNHRFNSVAESYGLEPFMSLEGCKKCS